MKKAIIFLTLMGMVFSSCSSDSTGNKAVKFENMIGKWTIKELIKPDGTRVSYINQCGESKDYIEFYVPSGMKFHMYYGDTCSQTDVQENCTGFFIDETNTIRQCNEFLNGHISKLTAHEMQIDFEVARNFFYNDVNIKGIVLER